MTSYNEIYIKTRNELRELGIENSSQQARFIVAKAAGRSVQDLLKSMQMYTTSQIANSAHEYVERLSNGEPIAYILGEWEFYGIPIIVTPDVLIPRIDTEVIVDAAKEILTGNNMNARILDLCCGSGCISCAISKELPATRIVAADISFAALDVCRKNIAANRLNSKIVCMQADATANPPCAIGTFDMIVCNPPYIASSEIPLLDKSVRNYEPTWALDGGEDGLKFYRSIIKYWKTVLKPGAFILFEVGEGQADDVSQLLLTAGFKQTYYKKDSINIDRVVIGQY